MNSDTLTPAQASELLKLSAVNLKKYAIMLENNGHNIGRNGRGHRVYNDTDIKLFRAIIVLNRTKNMNLDDAAEKVCESNVDIDAILSSGTSNDADNSDITLPSSVIPLLSEEISVGVPIEYRSLLEQIQKQNEDLLEKINSLESKIDSRDQFITNIMNEVLTKLDVPKEEVATTVAPVEMPDNKKGWFSRLFKK